ncbi:hypothetical protein RND81_13G055400 [Saponaria officinalis]|uniref:Uncharacterized protein n=1 Tax=Saponaria officinalis TaxID=3572 RepID=A0AAW1GUC5_SAPOF
MEVARLLVVLAVLALTLCMILPSIRADSEAHSPAPAPTSDGTTIDQGIAYALMLVALALTYLIH